MKRKTAIEHMIYQQENWRLYKPTTFRPKVLAKLKRELVEIERKEQQHNK